MRPKRKTGSIHRYFRRRAASVHFIHIKIMSFRKKFQEIELIKTQKIEKMAKLKALRDSGALTEKEYQNEINKILGKANK